MRVKNLTIRDLEQTLENIKKTIGVDNRPTNGKINEEDEEEYGRETYDNLLNKIKEFEDMKNKIDEQSQAVFDKSKLEEVQNQYDQLLEKFELLKTKSIALYQNSQKLDQDNQKLSELVFKYKREKTECVQSLQEQLTIVSAQNLDLQQDLSKLRQRLVLGKQELEKLDQKSIIFIESLDEVVKKCQVDKELDTDFVKAFIERVKQYMADQDEMLFKRGKHYLINIEE